MKLAEILKIKTLSRIYGIIQIGYSQLGWLVSIFGWGSIIGFVLTKYIPSWLVYILLPIAILIGSLIIGLIFIRKDIYKNQGAVGTEQNIYLNKILGMKDYISWVSAAKGLDVTEETTKLDILWFKKVGYDTKGLETKLERYIRLRKHYEDLIDNANITRDVPEDLKYENK